MILTVERRKPLKRTGLKRPTRDQVIAWEQKPRTPLRRTRLKQGRGAKALREAEAIGEFRGALRERSGGECEVEGFRETMRQICGTDQRHPGAHAHHVWPEDRDDGRHDPDRGRWVCPTAHAWIHDHPADAAIHGLLRPDRSPRPTL